MKGVKEKAMNFGQQLEQQEGKIMMLMNNLNQSQEGLGDQVMDILDNLAKQGAQAQLTPETIGSIEQLAKDTPPDQLEQKINNLVQFAEVPDPVPQAPMQSPVAVEPPPAAIPPPGEPSISNPTESFPQQYKTLKDSGMNAAQIIQQNPNLSTQVVPDGSILNTNTGVGLIQTEAGEAYKLPSGLIVPRDTATGFYNLSALSPADQQKLSFYDVMALDLSTQKTTSNLKSFYTSSMLQSMSQRNQREYEIAKVELDSFYNSETNRVSESKIQSMQQLEIEKMRQELAKDTSMQKLDEAKSKTSALIKAQMDAWGLEGSSAFIAELSAHNLRFEQESNNLKKTYDINLKELAMASVNTEMQFANRITEINQRLQVDKFKLENDFINRRDEIDKSILLSNIERITEQGNMYRDYNAQIYDYEQSARAAAAEAESAAQAEMWEKQKWYAEQTGMLISIGEGGNVNTVLDEQGNPVRTLAGEKLAFEQEKYGRDYMLREQQFMFDQQKYGMDYELRMAEFDFNREKFGLEYAMDQDKLGFEQGKWQAEFSQENEQFWASMKGFDMTQDENGNYIGTNAMGEVVNFGSLGVPVPINSKYDYSIGPDEVRWNVPIGKMTTRGECGMLVNDALFGESGHMLNSFESKMKYDNSDVPVAGGAFVEYIAGSTTGHTGLVEKVHPDGSFEIRESNYHSTWEVTTETIYPGTSRWKTIVEQGGFYDPLKGGTSRKEGQTGVTGEGPYATYVQDLMSKGMSKTDAIDLANKKMEEGSLPGFVDEKTVQEQQQTLSLIDKIRNSEGLDAGIGRSRFLSAVPGTKAADFKADFDSLMSRLTIENLGMMSGTLTDNDIKILTSAATSLTTSMSKEKFLETLDEIESKLLSANEGLTKMPGTATGEDAMKNLQSNPTFMQRYGMLNNDQKAEMERLFREGATEGEMLQAVGMSSEQQTSSSGYTFNDPDYVSDDDIYYYNLLE